MTPQHYLGTTVRNVKIAVLLRLLVLNAVTTRCLASTTGGSQSISQTAEPKSTSDLCIICSSRIRHVKNYAMSIWRNFALPKPPVLLVQPDSLLLSVCHQPRLGYTRLMETENFQYEIVMDDGPDTEVLGRLAHLELASAAYQAAVFKYPLRNIQLRQGAQIIKRHDGEPRPAPPPDPNLKSWSAHLIAGKKLQLLGYLEAVSEGAAIDAAVALFNLDDQKRKRLAVNLRRRL
jgi:hypothetical protein